MLLIVFCDDFDFRFMLVFCRYSLLIRLLLDCLVSCFGDDLYFCVELWVVCLFGLCLDV